MKKTLLIVLLVVVFVLILGGAFVLYQHMSAYFAQMNAAPQTEDVSTAPPQETETLSPPSETPVTEEAEAEPEPQDEIPPVQIGNAPAFTVYDVVGEPVTPLAFLGRPVVVNFWATWCPPCRAELPAFNAAAAEYTDIVFMMVDLTDGVTETQDVVRAFIEENGYSFPVFFDTDYSGVEAYQISAIPLTVFIDANGDLVDTHVGSMTEDELRSRLDQLLSN